MGFFGEIDASEISTGPKAGTYPATISDVEVNKQSKAGDNYIVFHYEIADSSFDFPAQDWFRMPETLNQKYWDDTVPVDDKGNTERALNLRALKFFKRRLEVGFGVPPNKIGAVGPENLIGLEVVVKVTVSDSGMVSVASVTPKKASTTTLPVTTSTPVVKPLAPVSTPEAVDFPDRSDDSDNPFDTL